MGATSLLQAIQSGEITIRKAIDDAVSRIEETHSQLNATTEILKENIPAQPQQLPDGPLKGLPISIKECYAIKGKQIRSGSLRMKPIDCKEDAAVVRKLKNAGAVIVARGNSSEFLLGRETDNRIYGTTNNAINPALTCGGSSGGDGTLTASNCVAFGIGTDIGGSCRYPALFNGIVGFKPASGQIDKTGIFPSASNEFVETMNSPGVLCRSVRDARLVYNVIVNKQLHANDVTGNFQLYTSNNFRVKINDDSIKKALEAATAFLKTKSSVTQHLDIPESGSHYLDFVTFITGGFTNKVYEWSVTEDGKKLSFFSELLARLRKKPTLSDEIFAMLPPFNLLKPSKGKLDKVIRKTEATRTKYYSALGNNGILILPTTGILAPPHKKFIPQYNKPGVIEIITPVSFCNVFNLSCITVPAWKFQRDKNVNPPGIQLISAPGNEEMLLNAAELLEKYLGG